MCRVFICVSELLLDELKAQGKEYGYFFKQVDGGSTMTDIRAINSFSVAPLEAYRVDVETGEEVLVRNMFAPRIMKPDKIRLLGIFVEDMVYIFYSEGELFSIICPKAMLLESCILSLLLGKESNIPELDYPLKYDQKR